MLPGLEAFLAGMRLFVRRRPKPIVFDELVLANALDHAVLLAADGERHEPAASFSPVRSARGRSARPRMI
jgi:hypothetical protein